MISWEGRCGGSITVQDDGNYPAFSVFVPKLSEDCFDQAVALHTAEGILKDFCGGFQFTEANWLTVAFLIAVDIHIVLLICDTQEKLNVHFSNREVYPFHAGLGGGAAPAAGSAPVTLLPQGSASVRFLFQPKHDQLYQVDHLHRGLQQFSASI